MFLTKNELLNLSEIFIKNQLCCENPFADFSEISSWLETIKQIKKSAVNLKNNIAIALEYKIPFSAGRADLCLFYKMKDGFRLLIIEMKDWSNQNVFGLENQQQPFKLFFNSFNELRYHPAIQVLSYKHTLETLSNDFGSGLIGIKCFVIMPHYNLENDKFILDKSFEKYNSKIIYLKSFDSLVHEINLESIEFDERELLNKFSNIKFKTSNQLFLSDIFENNNFEMINEEVFVFKRAVDFLSQKKHVIVVGKPGSGKTAIGLSVAKHFFNQNLNISYGSANEIKNCFDNQSLGIKRLDGVFKVFGNCVANPLNKSLVIFDEAHRMMKYQVDLFARQLLTKDVCSLWLIDDGQSFRKGEDNSVAYLLKVLPKNSVEILYLSDEQFRCGGDSNYTKLILELLNNRKISANLQNVKVENSIDVALYEYNQISEGTKGIVASDSWRAGHIKIGHCEFDTVKDFGVWSTSNIDDVASAYKSQGSQKDYILFLWGEEFVYRKDKGFIINPNFVKDSAWRYIVTHWNEIKQSEKDYMLNKFKALYYVLLTRFNKKMTIYCVDEQTRLYLQSIVDGGN